MLLGPWDFCTAVLQVATGEKKQTFELIQFPIERKREANKGRFKGEMFSEDATNTLKKSIFNSFLENLKICMWSEFQMGMSRYSYLLLPLDRCFVGVICLRRCWRLQI